MRALSSRHRAAHPRWTTRAPRAPRAWRASAATRSSSSTHRSPRSRSSPPTVRCLHTASSATVSARVHALAPARASRGSVYSSSASAPRLAATCCGSPPCFALASPARVSSWDASSWASATHGFTRSSPRLARQCGTPPPSSSASLPCYTSRRCREAPRAEEEAISLRLASILSRLVGCCSSFLWACSPSARCRQSSSLTGYAQRVARPPHSHSRRRTRPVAPPSLHRRQRSRHR